LPNIKNYLKIVCISQSWSQVHMNPNTRVAHYGENQTRMHCYSLQEVCQANVIVSTNTMKLLRTQQRIIINSLLFNITHWPWKIQTKWKRANQSLHISHRAPYLYFLKYSPHKNNNPNKTVHLSYVYILCNMLVFFFFWVE